MKNCDRIMLLEEGRISDIGSHDELMERCAVYREIYESQTAGSGDFDIV